jgi:hypothetical protein
MKEREILGRILRIPCETSYGLFTALCIKSRSSSVSKRTGCDCNTSIPGRPQERGLRSNTGRMVYGPPSLLLAEYQKRPGKEAEHSAPSRLQVKNLN